MKQYYESEVLFQLMERDGFNIPSSVPPYEAEIKAYLINQVKQAYPKLTDYEAEWLLYNYTKHLPADFPISSVSNVTEAIFENVVPFAYQSAILKGNTGYRDIDTGEFLETFEEGRNLELVSVKMPVLTTTGKNLFDTEKFYENVIKNLQTVSKSDMGITVGNPAYINGNILLSFGDGVDKRYRTSFKTTNSQGIVLGYRYTDGTDSVIWGNGSGSISAEGKIVKNIFMSFATVVESTINDIIIEEYIGNAHTYEPYKSNILSTSEDVELRGIGEVKDELNLLTGELTQRIGEVVLSSDLLKTVEVRTRNGGSFIVGKLSEIGFKNTKDIISNLRKVDYYGSEAFQIGDMADVNGGLGICFSTDGVNNTKEQGLLYLDSIRPKVYGVLTTPTIKTVDLTTVNESGESVHFMPLEGTMNVQSSGEPIQPTFDMSVPVEATTQNLASFIDLEMEE